MITVIADDITGAAEVAGVGLRHGLRVALDTAVTLAPSDVQLWVIALDTRSMQRDEAVKEITKTVARLTQLGIRQIFKKTDSVLRGHVVAELEAQLKIQGKKGVLLCPANPAGGRKIVDGTYYINDIPLHQTGFAKDPEFPATTSNVVKLLKNTSDFSVEICPQAASAEDLQRIAKNIDDDVIPAGSAAFFEAWLSNFKFQISKKAEFGIWNLEFGIFIVCGSAFHVSHERVEQARKNGTSVAYISPLWINSPEFEQNLQGCASQAQQALQQNGCAILAVDLPTLEGKDAAVALRTAVSKVAENILQLSDVQELIVEGGATAFAIAQRMGFTQFLPANELAPGVVRMKVLGRKNLYLTIKPGSYEFPKGIL
ncbi:MAG: four-carbon acid sugar kinase family protein [Prevotellaceae bacterium]|jgi:uncharacterized protein YgbK (DUF1537 family)|nr:four-carbon acid sugar kinase family protein [Prevotellaceae bacterium]